MNSMFFKTLLLASGVHLLMVQTSCVWISEDAWDERTDLDGDGFTALEADGDDCNDNNADVHPGLAEICDDLDNDCNGIVDDDAEDAITWFADADGDDVGDIDAEMLACTQPTGFVATATDCDDSREDVHPLATEICNDIDDDCDGLIDDEDQGLTGATTWYVDDDGDGYGSATDTIKACDQPPGFADNSLDCNDASFWIRPGVQDLCDDAHVDQDCDGVSDEDQRGDLQECQAPSCAFIHEYRPAAPSGVYWLLGLGDVIYDAYCEMERADGGWALAFVASYDFTDYWSWDQRANWHSQEGTIGHVLERHQDYKGSASHRQAFSDLLFIHAPSDVWAFYEDVGDGSDSFAGFIGKQGAVCYGLESGWAMTGGTLSMTPSGRLCSTDLYINPMDQDGQESCENVAVTSSDTWGPAWSVKTTIDDGGDALVGCPLDDVGLTGGLGPSSSSPEAEISSNGFGWGLGLNTGQPRLSENYMQVYVR